MITPTWQISTKKLPHYKKNWLLAILAKNRGLTIQKKLAEFLSPKFEQILKVKLTDTQKAIKRILGAIDQKEKIIVYSDYDADGVCATAILWETLYDLGANILPHVPHRVKEGYGLSIPTIDDLSEQGVTLIITVDHGVTAEKQINHAQKLGIDVIVTDHHLLPQKLPKPHALFHTTQLCGAGVAWRLAWEIISKARPDYKENLKEKLELAALATIADLVPLLDANRAIVKIGLEKLSQTSRYGIKALIKSAGINTSIGTYEIGHILAPRINAMGRIEHGMDSLRLLCAKSQTRADELAALLSRTNSKRQDLTVKAIDHAFQMVKEDQLISVIWHDSWHEGIIGLVAARIVEAYHKPTIVISKGEIYSKGSARSIPGFNIVEAIRNSSEYLIDGGGHPMAAGFTIKTRYIEIFAQKINDYAASRLTEEHLTPIINIECELPESEINFQNYQIIEKFKPYGMGNPEPIFLTRKLLAEEARTVGADNRHLKLALNGHSAIGFNMGNRATQIRPGYLIDLVYTLAEDHYNNNHAIQLKIKDVAIHPD